ncbi:hypothetical protein ACWENQ_26180 [Nonomuraea sp. NPDC004354]
MIFLISATSLATGGFRCPRRPHDGQLVGLGAGQGKPPDAGRRSPSAQRLLSDEGVPLESISRLVGHFNTTVTETVYRKQLRPVMLEGAQAMDRIFPSEA